MGLAAWFKEIQAQHKETRRIAACIDKGLQAIVASDPVALKAALAPVELNDDDRQSLLGTAIEHGDAQVFRAVLEATGDDPNAAVAEIVYRSVGRLGSAKDNV